MGEKNSQPPLFAHHSRDPGELALVLIPHQTIRSSYLPIWCRSRTSSHLQGYLAQEKAPPPRILQEAYA